MKEIRDQVERAVFPAWGGSVGVWGTHLCRQGVLRGFSGGCMLLLQDDYIMHKENLLNVMANLESYRFSYHSAAEGRRPRSAR